MRRCERRPDKRVTRHPATGVACCTGGRGSVGRIRRSRHPAMGFSYGIGGMIPFTRCRGVSLISYAVNGIREAAALPLSIPAAPRGNRCCALRSPPACLTAAGSTRHPVSVRLCPPSMASRPCHSRFGSPISAGVNKAAVIPQVKAISVWLWARFGRPDKAQPPSGKGARGIMPDGAALIRPTQFQPHLSCWPDKA